jgi:hypothetical protein
LEIETEEFRRRYAELSDEGLLSIDRDDLTEIAQQYYDAEFAQRGLHPETPSPVEGAAPDEKLVLVETFLSVQEANVARGLLLSAGIPASLEPLGFPWTSGGEQRLVVPDSFSEQAKEILEARV